MTAAYISLSTGRSPNTWGMIFVRRRSSRKRRSSKFVVRITRRWRNDFDACIAHLRFPRTAGGGEVFPRWLVGRDEIVTQHRGQRG